MFTALEAALNPLFNWVLERFFHHIAEYMAKPLAVALAIHGIWLGVLYFRGRSQVTSLPEIGWVAGKAGLIGSLSQDWPIFKENVYLVVWDVYQNLGTVILFGPVPRGSPGLQIGGLVNAGAMDVAFAAAVAPPAVLWGIAQAGAGAMVMGNAPALGLALGQVACGILEVLVVGFFFGSLLLLVLTTKLMLLFALGLAPIFIVLYLFDTTRPIADSWMRTLIGLALTPALVQVTLAFAFPVVITLQLIFTPIAAAAGGSASAAALHAASYVAMYGGLGALMLQMPAFASGLVGSIASGPAAGVAQHMWGGAERLTQNYTRLIEEGLRRAAGESPNSAAQHAATAQTAANTTLSVAPHGNPVLPHVAGAPAGPPHGPNG